MAFAFVQSTSFASGSLTITSETLQYVSNVTAGNLLWAVVSTFTTGVTVSVSDDQNGAWTQAGSYSTNGVNNCSIWFFPNTVGAVKPIVTVTPSIAAYISFAIHEHSGGATASPLHSTITNTGSATTSIQTGTCTAAAGELVVAGYAQGSIADSSLTVASPFTLREHKSGSVGEGLGSASDENAAGSEGATFTINGNVTYAAIAASFKLPAAAAFVPWGNMATFDSYPNEPCRVLAY